MADLRDGLLAGDLDLILVPAVEAPPGFEQQIIDSEPVVMVGSSPSPSHAVELSQTADTQLILVPDACGLTRFTKQLFSSHDLPLRTYPGEASSYRVLEQWANLRLGSRSCRSRSSAPRTPAIGRCSTTARRCRFPTRRPGIPAPAWLGTLPSSPPGWRRPSWTWSYKRVMAAFPKIFYPNAIPRRMVTRDRRSPAISD